MPRIIMLAFLFSVLKLSKPYKASHDADATLMRNMAKQRRSNKIMQRMAHAGHQDCYESKGQLCHAHSL